MKLACCCNLFPRLLLTVCFTSHLFFFVSPLFSCRLIALRHARAGFFRVIRGNDSLLIEDSCTWATPGQWTEHNFPCYEDGMRARVSCRVCVCMRESLTSYVCRFNPARLNNSNCLSSYSQFSCFRFHSRNRRLQLRRDRQVCRPVRRRRCAQVNAICSAR
jgi:hypothetical protein